MSYLTPGLPFLMCFLCMSLFSSGCGSSPEPEPEIKELTKVADADKPEDGTERGLFDKGRRYYAKGLYTVAKETFESLRNNFPAGAYTEFAELKIADCNFELNDFEAAAISYEEFAKSRPSSSSAPYALLQAARCARKTSKGDGRDPASLEKSLALYDKFLKDYAHSPYSTQAIEGRREVAERLATYEQMVADFYKKKGKQEAYEARSKVKLEKWDPMLKEAEAAVTTEAAVREKQQSILKTQAKAVVTEPHQSAARTQAQTTTPSEKASTETKSAAKPPADANDLVVQSIECQDDGGKKVIIYLNKPLGDSQFLVSHEALAPNASGKLVLELPKARTRVTSVTCFDNSELEVSENGQVKIPTKASGKLMSLNNPPRLLVFLE